MALGSGRCKPASRSGPDDAALAPVRRHASLSVMRGAGAQFARLLACLLLIQWAAALAPHARALATLGSAHPVEICTHDGVRTVLLGDDGQPLEKTPATLECCVLCQAATPVTATAPDGPVLRVTYVLAPHPLRDAGLPPGPPRAPPQQPRAPPRA